MTKARGCKVAGQEGSLGGRPHAPRSVRQCEGIDPHTPKGLLNVQKSIIRVKTQWIKELFISLKRY